MDRRIFIDAVALGLVAAPLAAIGQRSATVRRIGSLSANSPESRERLDLLYGPLRALGWIEGRNLRVERRYASGEYSLLPALAEELVRLDVEIIATLGTPAGLAAKNATKTIPIVLWSSSDPVANGLVASLARPGGNVTGFSFQTPELDIKRVELLHELIPDLLRIGVLETTNPYFRARRSDFERACRTLGVQPIFFEVATENETENAVKEMAHRGAQALLVPQEPLFFQQPAWLMNLASKHALPTITGNESIVAAGALALLATTGNEQDERFAWCVDKILRGAKPADIPVQQPTKFRFVVNLKAAKALGLTVPRSILLRADEVIE